MYTVEMDHDEVKIILIDENESEGEVEFYLYDDCVVIKQHHYLEEIDIYDEIRMTPEQFEDLRVAFQSPEGVFYRKK